MTGDVRTVAGAASLMGSWDGPGSEARFMNPLHMAVNASGDLFVSEAYHSIRRIDSSGTVTTVAGMSGWPGFADGSGAEALFNFPSALTFARTGDLYIADMGNAVIRKMAPDGKVSLVAGSVLETGSLDGIGSSARFLGPSGLAADLSETVYVADSGNHTIRQITPAGLVSTWAGITGVRGHSDGPLASATFDNPGALERDNLGNIYCADLGAGTIRKVSPAGMVTSIGTGLKLTGALAVDGVGNLYAACWEPVSIKKIDPAGQVTVLIYQSSADSLSPGTVPSSILSLRALHIASNHLYILADCSVLKAGPLP